MESKPEITQIHYSNGYVVKVDERAGIEQCFDHTGKEIPLPEWYLEDHSSSDMDVQDDDWPIDRVVEILGSDEDDDDDHAEIDLMQSSEGRERKTSRWTKERKNKD